jgi:hypothetical protein
MQDIKKLVCGIGFCLMFPAAAQADLITFNFTGKFVLADYYGTVVMNEGSPVTPIAASLTYDTENGVGTSNLSISMSGGFWGIGATFHDISMAHTPGTNLIEGYVLADWNGNYDMPMHVQWDATGLFNAVNYGLQPGDIISGTNLYRDTDGNGFGDAGEWLANVYSATPYSDILQQQQGHNALQGPAPMAATSGSQGLGDSTPFPGIKGYFDIGSGNSMHVVSVTTVPIPAAVWLFGSGLLGLMGFARRRAN